MNLMHDSYAYMNRRIDEMNTQLINPFTWRKGLVVGLLVTFLLIATSESAQAQEIGNFCVQDYQTGANCTANDVRIEELRIIQLIKPCNVAPTGVFDAEFEILISAAQSPNRYDIGVFLAMDGGSALTGDYCYHDYLPPPITPTPTYGDYNADGVPDIYNTLWYDGENLVGDTCGDIGSGTQVFRVSQIISVACVDLDDNGVADISVCSSWDQNAGADCGSVKGAIPGGPSKCSCGTINFDFTPTAVEGLTFSAGSKEIPADWILTGFGLLLLGGAVFSGYARYRLRAKPPV
jgi:hypothetical protein